jgi:hypothetical protein
MGKPNDPKVKKLRTHSKVVLGYIYVSSQEKSLIDVNTMKTYIKEIWFKESIYKTTKNTLLVKDRSILDFIFNAWYKVDKINKENIIRNSFRDTGITLNTDGSRHVNCLKIPNEFIEEMKLEDNNIDNIKNDVNCENNEETSKKKRTQPMMNQS